MPVEFNVLFYHLFPVTDDLGLSDEQRVELTTSIIPYLWTEDWLLRGGPKKLSEIWISNAYNHLRQVHMKNQRAKLTPCRSCTVI